MAIAYVNTRMFTAGASRDDSSAVGGRPVVDSQTVQGHGRRERATGGAPTGGSEQHSQRTGHVHDRDKAT